MAVAWNGVPLVPLDGFQSCDWTDNNAAIQRDRLGQQGQNIDQLYQNTTGTVSFAATTESFDALRDAIRASVRARAPKLGSVVKTTFYPATGRTVVHRFVNCIFTLSESISGVAEQQVTIAFTTGTMPTTV